MNYWRVIFATVVIFGAGVVTGGLLVDHVRESHGRTPKPAHPAVTAVSSNSVATNSAAANNNLNQHLPEVVNKQFLPKLDTLLALSSDQHKAIERIIADSQAQMRKVSQDARLAIRSVLTPDQRSRFDDFMKHPKRPAANTNVVDLLSTNPITGASTNSSVTNTNH